MKYTDEQLLAKATEMHDEKVGRKHCDRKYLTSCSTFSQSILRAPAELDKENSETV